MSTIIDKLKTMLMGSGRTSIRPAEEIAGLLRHGAVLLDVRTEDETQQGCASGAMKIPLLGLRRHLDGLPRDKVIVTYCRSGGRAGKARDILVAAGFKAVNGGGYEGIRKIRETM